MQIQLVEREERISNEFDYSISVFDYRFETRG